jgi:putative tryptophan/tyrosine transport system substrate-binding protein
LKAALTGGAGMIDRRSFTIMLATATFVQGSASTQPAKSATIAYLALLPGEDRTRFMAAFKRRLGELGYADGRNLRLIYRSAEGKPELLPAIAADLVAMKPDVLVTGFGTVAARTGKAAAHGLPVVFLAVGDPVGAGVVDSLAHPGDNITGLSDLAAGLQGSRLQLLHEMMPNASLIAVLLNPGTPYTALAFRELEGAAKTVAIQVNALEARSPEEIAPKLEAAKATGAGGIVVLEDPLTLSRRNEIALLVSQLGLPAIYGYREFAEAGGLMSYGTDHEAQWRRGAEILDLILKGAKPADIPVEQPTTFELVVNLKAAKALGLTLPQTIMIRADVVIE